MSYLAACFVTVVAVELFLHLPVGNLARQLNTILRKVQRILGSKTISDYWKEKVLPVYASRLAGISLKLGVILALVGVVVCLLSLTLDSVFSLPLSPLHALTTWLGAGLSLLTAPFYCLVRSYIATV